MRDAAIMEDGPFQREGLARRQAARGTSFLFFGATATISPEDRHNDSPPPV